jgi:hypothetical protein
MSEETLSKIQAQLEQLTLLTALASVKGMKPTEAIVTLGTIGLDRNLIAKVTGSTPNAVSVRLSEAKKKKSSKKPPRRKGAHE